MKLSIEQTICEAVEMIVEQRLKDLQFNCTITCTIIEQKNNKYNVRYHDVTFPALPLGGESYSHGDIVNVLVINNDFSKDKYILGIKEE